MDTRASGGPESDPEPIRQFRGQGWYNVWGLLLAVFAGLLCVCAYWIVRAGLGGTVDSPYFGYALFLALVLGVVLIGRWSVPYLLRTAPTIDPRNARLMMSGRAWWLFRRKRAPEGESTPPR